MEALERQVHTLGQENKNLSNQVQQFQDQVHQTAEENQLLEQRVTELEGEMERLKVVTPPPAGQPIGSVQFTMTDFQQHKRDDTDWYSPPFYTHLHGYKMCLRINASSRDLGKGTHTSLYFHMMKGEFDDHLKWPFRGDITIQLLNQEGCRGHFSGTLKFTDDVPDRTAGRAVDVDQLAYGLGYPQFIPHTFLRPKYLKNNCLKIYVKKVILK